MCVWGGGEGGVYGNKSNQIEINYGNWEHMRYVWRNPEEVRHVEANSQLIKHPLIVKTTARNCEIAAR